MNGHRSIACLPGLDTLDGRIMPATAHHAVVAHAVHAVVSHIAHPATIHVATAKVAAPAATVTTPAAVTTPHAAVVTSQVTLPSPSTGTASDGETYNVRAATTSTAVPVSFPPQEYPTGTASDGETFTAR